MRRVMLLGPILAACVLCGCTDEPEAGYRVAVIPKGLTHEFWQSIHRGAEHAAHNFERQYNVPVHIVWDGPLKENDALDQIRIVDRRITNRVSAIVLAPQHSHIMIAPVQRAVDHHIPVVIIDSGLANEAIIAKYVATNNYHGGELAGEHLIDILAKEGKTTANIILFRYQVGSESTDQREKGFEHAIDHQTRVKVNWLSRDKYAGATKETAKREADPLIARLKDKPIDGIFAPNESSTNGMLDALRGQGMAGKVRLMGFDSSAPLLQAMDRGEIDGLILQDPYKMGYLGTWTALWKLEGHEVAAEGIKPYSTRKPQVLDLGHKNEVAPDGTKAYSTGEYFVNRDNLHTEAIQGLFDPALQVKRHIELPPFLLPTTTKR